MSKKKKQLKKTINNVVNHSLERMKKLKPADRLELLLEIGEWILSVNNTFKNETFKEAKEETLKEAERRAYVAMTRASKHLVIIWANVLRQEGNPLISFLFGPKALHSNIKDLSLNKMNEWLKGNKVAITIDSVRETKITKNWSKSTLNRILEVGPVPKRILDKDWGRHSYSS